MSKYDLLLSKNIKENGRSGGNKRGGEIVERFGKGFEPHDLATL